jgi:Chromo (CHRromatin Organisation MOdifier) domain
MATERDWNLHLGTACLSYYSSVHSSTGYVPIELSSTREPAPSVWTRQVILAPRDSESKIRYRKALLARAARLCTAAIDTNQGTLERYKPVAKQETEYVIDRLISHTRDESEREWIICVRWAGLSAEEDTWEPVRNLPANMVRRYEKRKKLAEMSLSSNL